MSKIFIAGSITIKQLSDEVKSRINNMITSELCILVGDANGVDSAVQRFLASQNYPHVTIYCSGQRARNNHGNWPTRNIESQHASGTRAFFTEKDIVMARDADYGFMIWDMESTGTLRNILELLGAGKKTVAYLQSRHEFVTIGELAGCKRLISMMTGEALAAAEKKMGLSKRIRKLEAEQVQLF